MLVQTANFGEQLIDANTVISFPRGLPGFDDCIRFKLFHREGGDPLIHWLQSLDHNDVMFSITDPTMFGISYDVTLTDEETELLGGHSPEDMLVLILLYRDGDTPSAGVKGSIKAPLIVNGKTLRGVQKVLVDIEPSILLKESNRSIEFKGR